jgi:radical SAM superfamily enzyme
METKKCRVCGAIIPVSEFPKAKLNRDGHSNSCKFCTTKYNSKRCSENREKLNEQNKAWRKANPQKQEQLRIRHYIYFLEDRGYKVVAP